MRFFPLLLLCLLTIDSIAQVLDVNGDNQVGAEEALAVAEDWKGLARRANDHNHLGQIWEGFRNPLIIRGEFPETIIIGPAKENEKADKAISSAPLLLDNTAPSPDSLRPAPDLLLLGYDGAIGAVEHEESELHLISNHRVFVHLDSDGNNPNQSFIVTNSDGFPAMSVQESGNVTILGTLTTESIKVRSDHPTDPANKFLNHAPIDSPSRLNLYRGRATLDENGEAWVELPEYVEALNGDFEYQLTCIGAFAPVHVAEEARDNRFKIAGGSPGLEVSWMVTGIRQDPGAKANPLVVEEEKSAAERGKFLRPGL
jgi:hypothetical protein